MWRIVSSFFLTMGQWDYETMGDFLLFRVSKSQSPIVSMPPRYHKKRENPLGPSFFGGESIFIDYLPLEITRCFTRMLFEELHKCRRTRKIELLGYLLYCHFGRAKQHLGIYKYSFVYPIEYWSPRNTLDGC